MSNLQKGIAAAARGDRSLPFDLLGKDKKRLQEIPLANIQPDPNQPRRQLRKIDELAASIQERGLLQPIIVSPLDELNYQIVMGERRYTACKQLGMEKVSAIVMTIGERDRLTAQIVENLQRDDLDPFDEARGYQTLKESLGLKDEEIAIRVSKSRSYITKILGILRIPESVREYCEKELPEGRSLNQDLLERIARQKTDDKMRTVFDEWAGGVTYAQRVKSGRVKAAGSSRKSEKGSQDGTKPKKAFPEHQGVVVIAQSMKAGELTHDQIESALTNALEIHMASKLTEGE